jgi:hypothetical protein
VIIINYGKLVYQGLNLRSYFGSIRPPTRLTFGFRLGRCIIGMVYAMISMGALGFLVGIYRTILANLLAPFLHRFRLMAIMPLPALFFYFHSSFWIPPFLRLLSMKGFVLVAFLSMLLNLLVRSMLKIAWG